MVGRGHRWGATHLVHRDELRVVNLDQLRGRRGVRDGVGVGGRAQHLGFRPRRKGYRLQRPKACHPPTAAAPSARAFTVLYVMIFCNTSAKPVFSSVAAMAAAHWALALTAEVQGAPGNGQPVSLYAVCVSRAGDVGPALERHAWCPAKAKASRRGQDRMAVNTSVDGAKESGVCVLKI